MLEQAIAKGRGWIFLSLKKEQYATLKTVGGMPGCSIVKSQRPTLSPIPRRRR
jgi:hypothetical protein